MSLALIHLFVLIVLANGAPILARNLLGNKADYPIDGHLRFIDKRPLFGHSKTWRGLIASLVLTSLLALLLGYALQTGLLIALAAMGGDLLTSFIKRRLNLPSSSMAPLFDQVAESLFPALLVMKVFALTPWSISLLVLAFILFDLLFSRLLYKIGLRRRPY
ncbi:MAG TPA: CDP-archaeol synthase [Gammaproteobacteria bacterium]